MKKIKIYNTTTQEWQDISAGQTGPRGAQGEAGPKGDSFTYEDFTAEQLANLKGPKGDTGQTGATGATGPQGPTGPTGPQGPAGAAGSNGADGITPIVTITNITGGHNIDFSYGTGDARNTNVNIYDGAQGNPGTNGTNGTDGDDGITPTVTITNITGGYNIAFSYGTGDSRNTDVNVYNGAAGNDGHTPVITSSKTGTVTSLYVDGVEVATINDGAAGTNGADGSNGTDGDDGITPVVTVTSITGGHNVAFSYGTGDSRNTNFDVMDGEDASGGGGLPSIIAGTGTASEIFNYAESGNSDTGRATGNYSHAEGYNTNSWAQAAHAEGQGTTAWGNAAHAEGYYTTARGNYTHAEGNQTVINNVIGAHTEGYYTVASSDYQHVQGKYNAVDATGTYAHIVGNGTSASALSNAHTLDWSGNAWYAGSVSAGTTATPAAVVNDNDLTTKAYVDNAISQGGGGGGSYTAGTGIDITNGVISLALEQAEGVEI